MKIRYLIALVLLALVSHAQTPAADAGFRELYQRRDAEATALYGRKEFAKAAAIHEELRRNPALAKMEDANNRVLYNLSCEYSLAGEKQKALGVIRDGVSAGAISRSPPAGYRFRPHS